MTDLLKNTVCYRIVKSDKKNNKLSHAYGFCTEDTFILDKMLKMVAKLIMCDESNEFCDECRNCRLIERGTHSDVTFYPREQGGKILVDDIDSLVAETYIKPIEGSKRIFVLSRTAQMNNSAQNKILKTLEEPPENVFILLGIENENALLPTIKSRIKKIDITNFQDEDLLKGLKSLCPDEERLKRAVAIADGSAQRAIQYYNDENNGDEEKFVFDVLFNMKNSRNVLDYAVKIDKGNIKEFLICLKKTMYEIMRSCIGNDNCNGDIKKLSKIYNTACCVSIIEKINKSESALFFNGNVNMIAENILLCILEEKFRWQKL